MRKYLLIFIIFGSVLCHSQNWVNIDTIYDPSVKSLKFNLSGLQTVQPFIPLNSDLSLKLNWDILGEDAPQLRYKIEYCNADWSPTLVQRYEFMDGFEDEPIRDFIFSSGTFVSYIHYTLNLPNDNIRWLLSGNYLLHVYIDDPRTPLFTRRFCVTESLAKFGYTMNNPTESYLVDTHHEFDFEIGIKGLYMNQPLTEIQAVITQNNRWDNAISGVRPKFLRNDVLVFDYENKIVFGGGKEFRNFDIRNIRVTTPFVKKINKYNNGIEALLVKEKSKGGSTYNSGIIDADGKFIIQSQGQDFDEGDRSEYVEVVFDLAGDEDEEPVYIVGELTDWQLKEEFRMKYDPTAKCLTNRVLLKQGRYEYGFATNVNGKANFDRWEGNSKDTQNTYSVLIYHRPFGQRYDRLIGVFSFKS